MTAVLNPLNFILKGERHMKASSLLQAENPMTGKKFNLLNPGTWIGGILFVIFAFIVANLGQRAANSVAGHSSMIGTTIQDPVQHQIKPAIKHTIAFP